MKAKDQRARGGWGVLTEEKAAVGCAIPVTVRVTVPLRFTIPYGVCIWYDILYWGWRGLVMGGFPLLPIESG